MSNDDDVKVEIPDFLTKRGITKLTDNIPEGHQVRAPAKLFATLFKEEIVEACTKPASADTHLPPD